MSSTVKKFKFEEVLSSSIQYFNGDDMAATTWINKYAVKTKDGFFLEKTPNDMHRRMSEEFVRMEAKYPIDKSSKGISDYAKNRVPLTVESIYDMFKDFKYIIPQGSVMYGLGNKEIVASLSNCIVLPSVYDSYGGIFQVDQSMAQLFKRRCGVGVDLSNLRPKNAKVSNAAGSTTGAVSFMHRFSNTTREVAQNGRRGALMLTMDIAHPDIEDFVKIKQDLTNVTGANISIRLSDEFMEAVEKDDNYTLRFPIDSDKSLYTKQIKAKELWNTIIECAHNTAEPGLIFWDRQHKYSTSSIYPGFKNESTNPCSEIAMQGGDSCRLIAVNLYNFVDKPFTKDASFNYTKLYSVVYEAQRLMDDLVDLELEHIYKILEKIDKDPEPDDIKESEKRIWKLLYETGEKGRRTGLGFTALADAVAAMGIKFDSKKGLELVDSIMREKLKAEFDSSIDMSITRGKLDMFDPKIEEKSDFIKMMKNEFSDIHDRMMKYGRRNISISTVAPTGTLSMLAQVSSGIEPVFSLSYTRRRKVNPDDKNVTIDFVDPLGDSFQEFTVYHPKLKNWMDITGKKNIEESPYNGATAPEIKYDMRIKMQSIVQKYTTHSISSTINLPTDIEKHVVGDIYMESWKKGLKGITVYRDGSRSGVLITKKDGEKENTSGGSVICYEEDTFSYKRPKKLDASIVRFQNNYEKWLAVVGFIEGRPYEIFTGKMEESFDLPLSVERGWIIKNKDEERGGETRYDFEYKDKAGYSTIVQGLSRAFNKEYWNYAKLISGILRHRMPLTHVVDLVNKLHLNDESINTWKAGVARTLKQFVPDGTKVDKKCSECGDPEGVIYEEGCLKCKSCGSSKCG